MMYGIKVELFVLQFLIKMENCPTDFEELWKKYINLVRILWNHASWRGKEILNASVLLKSILGLG